MAPISLGQLVSRLVSAQIEKKPGPGFRTWAIFQAFDRIGPPVTTYAEPKYFRNGRLTIQVSQSVWLTELSMMKQPMLNSINAQLPKPWVKEIVFRQGAQSKNRTPQPHRPLPIPQRVHEWSEAISDPELKRAFERMAAAALASSRNEVSTMCKGPAGPRVVFKNPDEDDAEPELTYGYGDKPTRAWTYDRWSVKKPNKGD